MTAVSVELRALAYVDGALLSVVNFSNAEYTVNGNEITFATAPTTDVEVTSFYNHDVAEIERTSEFTNLTGSLVAESYDYYRYEQLLGGTVKLSKTVAVNDYVWVIKNNVMLTHSVDYYLDSDLTTVKLSAPLTVSDILDVIVFGDNTVNNSYGFMQFKDMLNRMHYKRISKDKSTELAQALGQRDIEIVVVDGSVLSQPNPALNLPGVVEINGERIEYFSKNGNVLGQLRRATLGTGAPTQHEVSSTVLDIGPTETIPYADRHIVETTVSNGVDTTINLNYVPEVFGTLTSQHHSDTVDVFVGGYRLKKVDYQLFQETNGYPYSPEGDSSMPAEFESDGVNYGTAEVPVGRIVLTTTALENSKVVVVKKIGRGWEDPGMDLTNSNNDIANFIKNTQTVFGR
jgi:ABC-type amino acid transport substrate-binding protein